MKNLILIFFAIGALALFNACEKVIDVDLKEADTLIVIEGNISDEFVAHKVTVSRTKAFTENNQVDAVMDAQVSVKDLTLNKLYLFSASNRFGEYKSELFKGAPGHNYELSVKVGNQTYTAQSAMPEKVFLDSLSITAISFFGEERKYVKVNYQDMPNIANQYRYILYVNNEKVKGYFLDFDRFNDGKYVNSTLFSGDPELKTGDEVKLEFQCVDMNVYRYFFAISQIGGNGGPPTTPANPTSNFNNGALGYFSAHTKEEKSAIIP